MTAAARTMISVFLALACLVLGVISFRKDTLLLAFIFSFLLFVPRFRRQLSLSIAATVVVAVSTLSPLGITFVNGPGYPRIVSCCPGMPIRYLSIKKQEARTGKCAYCSDLVSGLEPKYYIVW